MKNKHMRHIDGINSNDNKESFNSITVFKIIIMSVEHMGMLNNMYGRFSLNKNSIKTITSSNGKRFIYSSRVNKNEK